MARKKLTEKEMVDILNADDSEIEFSDADEEVDTKAESLETIVNDVVIVVNTRARAINIFDDVMVDSRHDEEKDLIPISIPQLDELVEVEFVDQFAEYVVKEKKNIEFRRRDFHLLKMNVVMKL